MNRIRELQRMLTDGHMVYHDVKKDDIVNTWVARYNLSENTLIGKDGIIYSGRSPLNQFTVAHYRKINPQRLHNNNAFAECYVIWNEKSYNMDEWVKGPLQQLSLLNPRNN